MFAGRGKGASRVARRRSRRCARLLVCELLEPRQLLSGTPPSSLPDIEVTNLQWNNTRMMSPLGGFRGVDVTYNLLGQVPEGTEVGFYWATGPRWEDHLGSMLAAREMPRLTGAQQTVNDPAFWGKPPTEATYILAVADPNGLVAESNEDNNYWGLRLHSVAEIFDDSLRSSSASSVAGSAPDIALVEFTPGGGDYTLSEAEVALGVHHFNWVSQSELPPSVTVVQQLGDEILESHPYLDPASSAGDLGQFSLRSTHTGASEPFASQQVDDLPFYWNEPDDWGSTVAVDLDVRRQYSNTGGLQFWNSPRLPSGFLDVGESVQFYLRLSGVSAEGDPIDLGAQAPWFQWSSDTQYAASPGTTAARLIADAGTALPVAIAGSVTAPAVTSVAAVVPNTDRALSGGDSITIDVLSNDAQDGRSYLIVYLGRATHGTVAIDDAGTTDPADDRIVYTPEAGYRGPDRFVYSIVPTTGPGFATGEVLIQPAPSYATDEDARLTIDASSGVLAGAQDTGGAAPTLSLVTGPSHGQLTLADDGGFEYLPAADYNGPDSFVCSIQDGPGPATTVTIDITVRPVNDVPTVADDLYDASEDQPLVVSAAAGLLANDSDVEGDRLDAVLVSGPAHGELAISDDGSFRYVPDGNYSGDDLFTYRATDGLGNSAVAQVRLRVAAVNDPPVGADDSYPVSPGEPLVVSAAAGVLANDRDPEGDPLTAAVVAPPLHGSLDLRADGSFQYTSSAGFSGPDWFTYRVRDGGGESTPVLVALNVARDLGTIGFRKVDNLVPAAGDSWYRMTSSQAGYFTAEATVAGGTTAAQLALYDANMAPLQTASVVAGRRRIDYQAPAAGVVYYLRVSGTSTDVDLVLANLVRLSSTALTVSGTAESDTFVYDLASQTATINGLSYELKGTYGQVVFDGGAEADSASILGTAGRETATLRPGSATVAGGKTVTIANVAAISVTGNGGGDTASLIGSSSVPNRFYAWSDKVVLSGLGFSNQALGFRTTTATGIRGADDAAYFYGSPAADALVAGPNYAKMSATTYENVANNFRSVRAYGKSDGKDTAALSGSTASNDQLTVVATSTALSTADYSLLADGFDVVTADGAGGTDYAKFSDSALLDTFEVWAEDALLGRASKARITATGYDVTATGFRQIVATSYNGGNDAALLHGTTGRDVFNATLQYDSLTTGSFRALLYSFERVDALGSTGGNDLAYFYAPAGGSRVATTPTSVAMAGGALYRSVRNFRDVYVYGGSGRDVATLADSALKDQFIGRPTAAQLYSTEYNYRINAFELVTAISSHGGGDAATLYDSAGADTLTATTTYAVLVGTGYSNRVEGFTRVRAEASGGVDIARFNYNAAADLFYGTQSISRVTGSNGIEARADYFEKVVVQGIRDKAAGYDRAYLYDSSGADSLVTRNNQALLTFGDGRTIQLLDLSWVSATSNQGGRDTKRKEASTDFVLAPTGLWINV